MTPEHARADSSDPAADPVPLDVDPDAPHAAGRVLVTNDDGIESPGLRALVRTLAREHEVVVVAPDRDVSGAGTGIGRIDLGSPPGLRRVPLDGAEAYAVDGPPGLAVTSAALGAFGPLPDLVVSGVNAGLNTGTSVIHSGTVGAALTARTFGISGVALSLASGSGWHWDTAMPVAAQVVRWILRRGSLTTLNVNVPAVEDGRHRGGRWATIDDFGHFTVASQVPDGTAIQFDVRDRDTPSDPACDTALCLAGHVTLTLLAPLGTESPPPDDPSLVVGLPPTA